MSEEEFSMLYNGNPLKRDTIEIWIITQTKDIHIMINGKFVWITDQKDIEKLEKILNHVGYTKDGFYHKLGSWELEDKLERLSIIYEGQFGFITDKDGLDELFIAVKSSINKIKEEFK